MGELYAVRIDGFLFGKVLKDSFSFSVFYFAYANDWGAVFSPNSAKAFGSS